MAGGNLSYGQLESLWIRAGGARDLAPLMAAIAMAESGGNPSALNPTDNNGTQTSWGLWQISDGTHGSPGPNALTPLGNARLAVAKYQSQGLRAWGTYDSGAYKQFLRGGVPPVGGGPGGGGGSGSGGNQQAQVTALLTGAPGSGAGGLLQETGTLLHGAALTLDRAFALFAPGQGWRIAFGAGAAAGGIGAYHAIRSGGDGDGDNGNLPLGIALAGAAAVAAFMALRPWPQADGRPIKPGAYVVDVLEGQPPPAGPGAIPAGEVDLTEAGLATLVGLWAAGKAAGAAGALGGILGNIWSWVKGIGAAGEEAAAAGAEDLSVTTGSAQAPAAQ